ncbi:hypothetical protein HB662_19810 [Roseomonas frigidaquae]|uniref:Uncharacterized protein n=1 Tax=Falsiroseomonas frigidaquae TaxID=487318 RepID=A0ABX1F3V4_9PROT|nr:hypothetical protein [Falsiroseomonas frigidaquae]NKE47036.1 hypothetical protein [Falsiroseomonas frigidaquae]
MSDEAAAAGDVAPPPGSALARALAALAAALAGGDDAQRAAVEAMLPKWVSRGARLDRRDAAIRDALSGHLPRSVAAKALEAELRRACTVASPGQGDARRKLVAEILDLNAGRPLAWRQLLNIAAANRTPRCNNLP